MRNLVFALLALVAGATVALAQSNYAIRPGDTLQVEVLEDPSLNRSALVLPDGSFSFPLAGSLQAGGRSVDTVREALAAALASNFAAPPTVFVSVAQLAQRPAASGGGGGSAVRGMAVYAMGEVAKPGRIEAPRGMTLLQGIAQAGGFTSFAATRRIELRRVDPRSGRETVYRFNYRDGGGISGATTLQEGDVIVVPERRLFE